MNWIPRLDTISFQCFSKTVDWLQVSFGSFESTSSYSKKHAKYLVLVEEVKENQGCQQSKK